MTVCAKLLSILLVLTLALRAVGATSIVIDPAATPRVEFGAARLRDALKIAGIDSAITRIPPTTADHSILVNKTTQPGQKEGFTLSSAPDSATIVTGADDTGTLYGCLELAARIKASGKLPPDLHFTDAPVFILRGTCIGMQKTYILPGRKVYEYPYTPELFPFFYDKAFWKEYLDYLVDHRMNTLYLWSGHPFSSLVKLKDYPYAIEVSDDVFQKNVEMYRYIAAEADKRGIWVVQMFYNILLPKPFAEKNGLATQLAAPTPIAADYTRKSIAEFVKQYPNVGLMICLGEALQGLDNQTSWLCDVILPGVKDGMAEAGITQEPPVVVRTHGTNLRVVLPQALKVYKNLYTEEKFNGESLTTWEPRGVRQELHLTMSKLAPAHIINVHILANLEPFRYGAQRFIKKCMQAARDRLGAKGLHLYPLTYWNWPDSPDKTDPPLTQLHRDWIWFEAWSRYAWNPDIDETIDHEYWISRLTEMYGSKDAAEFILAAYNDSGECAARLIRRFGITEGNRQTLSLGMTLDEMVNPTRYSPFPELWESQSPPGERLQDYADREWNKQPHEGETPPQIVSEVLDYSSRAVTEIDSAAALVTKNRDEFLRLQNDIHCIAEMSQNYADKANAALLVLRYGHSHDVKDMESAETFLANSLEHYRALAKLTEGTYAFANSMQTSMRRVPVIGATDGQPANYHWTQLLGLYTNELAEFQNNLAAIKSGAPVLADESAIKSFPKAKFTLLDKNAEKYEVQIGAKIFTDRKFVIQSLAPELTGLIGIRFSDEDARNGHFTPVEFEMTEPVYVLVGYIKSSEKGWLQVPNLETDALAGERGGIEALIQNAAAIESLPAVDVHALKFDKGRNKLDLRGSGSFIVLGVIPQSVALMPRDAHRGGTP